MEWFGTRRTGAAAHPGAGGPAAVLRLLIGLLLAAAVAFAATACARDEPPPKSLSASVQAGEVALEALPEQAKQTLALIRQGGPFPYRKDGSVFGNRERLLPRQPRGYYSEYTVPTPGSRDRGARRIVAGKGTTGNPATSGEYYYTDDHYQSFRRIRP
jgi:ribonuclease T1